jgi:hypothetical protein
MIDENIVKETDLFSTSVRHQRLPLALDNVAAFDRPSRSRVDKTQVEVA